MISDDALEDLKSRNPVAAVAAQWVTLRGKGGKQIGPCPICSDNPNARSAMRFECDSEKWVCAVCQDGGDVIRLVQKREGVDFLTAIARLGGAASPAAVTPGMAERRGLQAFKAGARAGDWPGEFTGDHALLSAWQRGWHTGEKRAAFEAKARERERSRLVGFCLQAMPLDRADGLRRYFRSRGLDDPPPGARLGWHPAMPYFGDGRETEPLLIHTGPAMLAPIIIDGRGRLSGLHITWLDPAGGKATIRHPDTGAALPVKKVRGSKAGGYIDLSGAIEGAERMIAGEGIETVLAVYSALRRAGHDLTRTLFRSAIDLGNLAGRALETIEHPDLKTASGRAQRVPGAEPDLESPAMPVPDEITDLILLGDGDSDPFLTARALDRAAARHRRPGRRVRVRFAAPGRDFNDMIKGRRVGDE